MRGLLDERFHSYLDEIKYSPFFDMNNSSYRCDMPHLGHGEDISVFPRCHLSAAHRSHVSCGSACGTSLKPPQLARQETMTAEVQLKGNPAFSMDGSRSCAGDEFCTEEDYI